MKNIASSNRDRWCNIRLTKSEQEVLKNKISNTTCRKISDYVRCILFEKPVTVRQRNQSLDDFMTVLILLRTELNQLGNNFNQVVKRLNSIPPSPEYLSWLPVAAAHQKELIKKIEIIQVRIDSFAELWLPK